MKNQEYWTLLMDTALKAGEAIMQIYMTEFTVAYKNDMSPVTKADREAHDLIFRELQKTEFPVLSEEGKNIPWSVRRNWDTFWMVDPLDGTKEFIQKNGEFTVNIALIEQGHPVMGVVYAPVPDILYIGEVHSGAYRIDKAAEKGYPVSSFSGCVEGATRLPVPGEFSSYRIVASRSHSSPETEAFIEERRTKYGEIEILSKGSSLKLCMIAEGQADVYPRFAPTMEWDTAAGHAVVKASGAKVVLADADEELVYNKEHLLNPWFLAIRENKNQ
jgi:3'(2'), 5'-bisphosphate nucleotidase